MPSTAPAYTIGGITRPALIFDNAGNIVLTPEAAAFAAAYGIKALYLGVPANTPYPPVAATLSAPADANAGTNTVLENAAAGTQVGLTAQANNNGGPPITYSLTENAGGRFQINANTGVVTVANASLLDYEAATGHAYSVTVQATDGIFTSSQAFAIGVGNVNEAPAGSNGTVTATEDTNYVFTAANFGFTDPSDSSAPNSLLSVRIATLPAAGTLLNNGVPVSAGDFVSAADIAAGHLVFVSAANASGNGYASFTFQVRDNGGTANGGVDTDATPNTISIDVTAANDAPSFSIAGNQTAQEDAGAQTVAGFVTASSPGPADEAGQTVSYVVSGNSNAGLFAVGPSIAADGTLTYTAAANAFGVATITVHAHDNGGTAPGVDNSSDQTFTITIGAVNDAPSATNLTQSLGLDEDAAPTALFTTAPVVADVDSTNVTATLTVANPAAGTLTGGGFTATANPGEYTFSGTPTAVNAALAAVQFDSAADFNGTTSVGVAIDDGLVGPQNLPNPTGTVSITVNAVNDAPTASNLTQSLSINEDGAATALFTLAPVVSDIDSLTVTATLTLVDPLAGVLTGGGFVPTATPGVFTFSGTPAQVSAALQAVQFDSADDFNGITDVGVVIDDGANGPQGSNPIGTGTVTINAVNDAPTATNLTQSLSVGEDGAPATLFTLAPSVADIDSSTVTATLTVVNTAAGTLTGGGFTATANPGEYTFSGTATQVNDALAAVQFDSASNFNGTTDVTVAIGDGPIAGPQGTNPTGTVSITITAVNDAPTATNLTQSLVIDEDVAATTLFTLPPVTADVDSANVTATLTLNAAAGFLNGAGAAVLNSGILTYTITGSPVAVNAALAAVTYDSAPDFNGTTSVDVTIDDGASGPQGTNPTGTVDITVNPVNDAPTVTATATNPNYAPGVDLFSGVTVSTVETGQSIDQLVLSVTGITANDESLTIDGDTVALVDGTASAAPTTTLGVSYSVTVIGGTATITITHPGLTGAQASSLIDGLAYSDATVAPGESARDITIVSLHDTGGTANGGVDTGAPGITSTVMFDIPPTISAGDSVTYTENDGATVVDSTITITDSDDTFMESATVVLSSGYASGEDVIGFTDGGGITGNLVGNTLTATGHATLAQYETFLESVTYRNTSENPSTTDRVFTYTVNDGTLDSTAATATVHVAAVDDAPSVTVSGNPAPTFVEDGAAVSIDNAIVIADVDSANLQSAFVGITGNWGGPTDLLTFDTSGTNITGSFSGGSGALTFSGVDTVANYQAVLRSVKFESTNHVDPSTSQRAIDFSVRDTDNVQSNVGTRVVNVTAVNDQPTLTATASSPTFIEPPGHNTSAPVDLFSAPSASTVEGGQTFHNLVVTVGNLTDSTEFLVAGGTSVDLVNANSETVTLTGAGTATASVVVAGGTATVTFDNAAGMTQAQVNALIDSFAYDNSDDTPTATTHTVTITSLSDDGLGTPAPNDNTASLNIASTVTVTPSNDAPVAQDFDFTVSAANNAISNTALVLDNGTGGAPVDPAGPQKTISGSLLTGATDVDGPGPLAIVAVTNQATTHGHVTITADGDFTYLPDAGYTGTDTFNYTLTDQNPGTPGTDSGQVTVNVAAPHVWYVDASAAAGGDGTSDNPFNSFTQLNGVTGDGSTNDDVDGANDIIFVYGGTYTGGIVLEDGQQLISQSRGLTVNSTALVSPSGSNAQINGTVVVGSGNSIDGITFGAVSNFSLMDNGGSVGSLTVAHSTINNGSGGAVSITHGGALAVDFDSITAAGTGGNGVLLAGTAASGAGLVSGSFHAGAGGTLTGSNLGFHLGSFSANSGGTIAIDYDGAINGPVQIDHRLASAGAADFSGNISFTGSGSYGIYADSNAGGSINFTSQSIALTTSIGATAVNLTNNTGSTITFGPAGGGNGLDIVTSGPIGFNATGGGTVTVTGTGNTISSATGTALILDSVTVGTGGLNFASVSNSGASNGILINTVGQATGSSGIDILGGSIANATTRGVDINATSADVSIAASISDTGASARTVEVTNSGSTAAGGNQIAFSGAIDENSLGINLDNNDVNNGATITFSGGLDIDSTTNTGFNATNGGTVNVTDPDGSGTGIVNSITTTTGTALNVVNTNIGSGNLIFRDISSGTGANSTNTGIILDTTGTSGGLHVTGSGATVGSGGTIQHKTGTDGDTSTGIGIYLNNTSDVQLNGMQLNDFQNFGIRGNGVTGFTLDHSTVNGINGTATGNVGGFTDAGEGSVYFGSTTVDGLSGTASIINSTISGGASRNVSIIDTANGSAELHLTVDNDTFGLTQNLNGNQSLILETRGAGTTNHSLVTDSTFAGAASDLINFTGQTGTTMHVVVGGAGHGNTFANTHASNIGGGGATFATNGVMRFDVQNNTFTGANGSAITLFMANTSTSFQGTFSNNTIGTNGVAHSGSETGNGIFFSAAGAGTGTLDIQNNMIQNYDGNAGIYMDNTGGSYTVNATIIGNTTRQPGAGAFAGLALTNGSPASGDTTNVFAKISNNDFSAGDPANANDIIVGASGSAAPTHTFTLSGATAADVASLAAIQTFLKNTNNLNGASAATVVTAYVDAPVTVSAFKASAALPPLPLTPIPMLAAAGGVQASSPTAGETHLSQAQLDSVVAAAIAQWAHAGASTAQLAALASMTFTVADLAGDAIGEQTPGHIVVDTNAAGHGWFVDATPNDNFEFTLAENAAGTDLSADPASAAAGHLDLLTAVMHEMGHELGLDHAAGDAHDLMHDTLVDGERRLPDAADVAEASGSQMQPAAGQASLLPIIRGTSGNDTVDAGHGGNILVGEAGADNFKFANVDIHGSVPPPLTHVSDYHFAEGDTFDFSALTSAFHPWGLDDTLVVRAVEDASGTFATLQVNTRDPSWSIKLGPTWVDVAQLDGAHAGDDVSVLIDNNAVHAAHLHVGLLA